MTRTGRRRIPILDGVETAVAAARVAVSSATRSASDSGLRPIPPQKYGVVQDSDSDTLDYVVSVRVVDDENNPVANCNEDGVAGSYLLYTVPDDRSWGRKVTLSALCISGLGSKTLVVELLNGSSEYLGGAEFVLSTERDIVGQLNEAGIPSPMETATHRY